MTTLNVLYLEDTETSFRQSTKRMNHYWPQLGLDNVFYQPVSTLEDALEELDHPKRQYHVFIVDQLLPQLNGPEELPEGIEAIKEARKKGGMIIVGLSQGTTKIDLRQAAMAAGAHTFWFRYELTVRGTEAFCRDIHDLLISEGVLNDAVILTYHKESDPSTAYIVGEIGEVSLKSLVRRGLSLDNTPKRIEVNHLTPGMSGAFVLRVDVVETAKPKVSYLLKLNRDESRLRREIANFQQARYSSRLLVNYLVPQNNEIAHIGGWYAIGAIFEKEASPLLNWLQRTQSKEQIEGMLRHIFLVGGLTDAYQDVSNDISPRRAIDILCPSLSRQARICAAIDDLSDVIMNCSAVAETDWRSKGDFLKRFFWLRNLDGIDVQETPAACILYKSHGDLHSRNILVTNGSPALPILIDTADFGIFHWAYDYARLLIDFLLVAYDAGVQSYYWDWMLHWRRVASALMSRSTLPVDDRIIDDRMDGSTRNRTVREAMRWMTDNLQLVCPAVNQQKDLKQRLWELQMAMAVELLRGAYRPDLTAPKQVLGLLAGYDALRAAEATYKKSGDLSRSVTERKSARSR